MMQSLLKKFGYEPVSQKLDGKIAQWFYELDLDEKTLSGQNIMEAKSGPMKGQMVKAFFELSASEDNYGASKFIQEPHLAMPVNVTEPLLSVAEDRGPAQEVEKRLVGAIIHDENGQVIERASISKWACFTGQEYDFDPVHNVLTLDGQQYKLEITLEADKNRLDGVAGVFSPLTEENKGNNTILNYELETLSSFAPRTQAELDQVLEKKSF